MSHFLSRLSEIIEGDILMTDNLRRTLNAAGKSRNKRDIVTDMVMRWPDGVVPYVLDANLSKYSYSFIKQLIAWQNSPAAFF